MGVLKMRWLDGITNSQTLGVGDGQRSLIVHGVTKSQTWMSDWTELNSWIIFFYYQYGIIFLSVCFQVLFLLSLVFRSLIMMYFVSTFFEFISFVFVYLLESVPLCLLPNNGKFSAIIFPMYLLSSTLSHLLKHFLPECYIFCNNSTSLWDLVYVFIQSIFIIIQIR